MQTWKQALKLWAQAEAKAGRLGTYIAHCYRAGTQYASAARVYGELFGVAHSGDADKRTWHRTYLAYNAGRAYAELGETRWARFWFSRAGAAKNDKDSAVAFYAKQALKQRDKLPALVPLKTPVQLYVKIPEAIMPIERGRRYESPLGLILELGGFGEAVGGGTSMGANKAIEYVGIDLEVIDDVRVIPLLVQTLRELRAPRGTVIQRLDADSSDVAVWR